jgi:hypothetical protein
MNKPSPAARLLSKVGGVRRRWLRPAALAAPAILALIVGLFSVAGRTGVSRAQGETLVRCDPAVVAGIVGQPLDVDIYVENVVDLYAADVRLSFDTTIAQIVDADPVASDIQILILDDFLSPDFVLRKNGDNVAGTIWYAASQVNPSPPATGSGPLARITFEAQQAGSFVMPITYHELSTGSGFQIPATPVDCQISFIAVDTDLSTYLPAIFDMP